MSADLRSELVAIAEQVARAAGQLLMDRPDSFTLTEKSSAVDFATQMDEQAERLIVKSLLAGRLDDGIIS